MLSMSGLKAGLVSLFQLFGNRLVSMLGLREPALRCSEDTGRNILRLHSGLSFAPQQRNESVLSVAGLKAGLISILQLFGDRLLSMLGLR